MKHFKIKNHKKNFLWFPKYQLSDWKLWFKMIFVFIMFITILDIYIRPMITNWVYLAQITDLIQNQEINSIETLIKIGVENNCRWITTTKDQIHVIVSSITFTFDGSDNFRATYSPFEAIVTTSSFFTILSNILIMVWMYVALIKPEKEGEKGLLSEKGSLIIATFITITFLIYNIALRPLTFGMVSNAVPWQNVISKISNEIMHTVGPLVFVMYVVLFMKHEQITKISTKQMQSTWVLGIGLLVSYGLFAIIRGLMKELSGTPIQSAYPYFFLQITNHNALLNVPGYAWFIIFVFILAGLCIGFSTLYKFLINKVEQFKAKKLEK